jgi:hypothetical protein
MSIQISDGTAWRSLHPTKPMSIYVTDSTSASWRDCGEVYINVGGGTNWKPLFYTPGSVSYTTSGSWTVPLGVFSITVTAVGGGGAGAGIHGGGYQTAALAGGPGGGIKNYVAAVAVGDVCKIVVGSGGGSGGDVGGSWNIGTPSGTATYFYINNVLRFTANAGNNAFNAGAGAPGGGSIVAIAGSSGTVVYGTQGGQNSGNDIGYSVWNFSNPQCGTTAITPPAPLPWYLGLTERGGWLSISY